MKFKDLVSDEESSEKGKKNKGKSKRVEKALDSLLGKDRPRPTASAKIDRQD